MLNTSDNQILNEIGELFGRYREADGSLSFFQNKVTKNAIQKIDFDKWLSSYSGNHPIPNDPSKDPFLKGVLNSTFYQDRFYEWQKRVLERLQNTNNDIYVVAPPGGGKTTPLMAHYMVDIFMGGQNGSMPSLNPDGIFGPFKREIIQNWSNIFHGLLSGKYMNGTQVPKCLFITPIRVLSFEQAEGFQEYFIDLILFLKSLMLKCSKRNNNESFAAYIGRLKSNSKSNIDPIVGNVFGSLGEEMYNKMNGDENRFNSFAKQFTENLICVKTGGGNGQFNDNPDNAIVSIATYGSAKNFISRLSKTVKFIVFDEAHLYMPSEYGPSSDRSQENEVRAAADAYTIIDGMAKQNAQIAFLSGTIHPDSAENFCNYLNRYYGRHLSVVSTEKGDTQSGNKTELHVIADDAIRDEKEQVNRIVKWVQNNEKGKAIILFSKRKIDKLVDESIKRLSQKDIRQDFNVNQSDRYRKEKIDRFRRALAYSNPNASAAEIQKEIDAFTKKEFPTTQQENIDRIKAKPGAMMITNKTLRNAVSYGIGYIYRQDEIEPNDPAPIPGESKEPIAEQDKLIVANLFSQGKINVLLATAAIGVGVNVNIRDMYLPSCMKFEKNKNNEGKIDLNNKREMSQLVNRTGRGRTPISGIYTPREFVPYMQNIVMAGAEDFNKVPAISIGSKDNLKDILIALSTAASSSKIAAGYVANLPKTTSNLGYKISQKLSQFSNSAKQAYKDSVESVKNVDWLWIKKRKEEEFNRDVADRERYIKYVNAQDKIDEYNVKLEESEDKVRKIETRIAQYEQELLDNRNRQGNRMTDDERAFHLKMINKWKVVLVQVENDQYNYAIREYNELKKEIQSIHQTSMTSNWRGHSVSKYNLKQLTDRMDAIKKRYGTDILEDKQKSIKLLNDKIEKHRNALRNVEGQYNSIRNNVNIPQSVKNDMVQVIQDYKQAIQDSIRDINNIQYIPTVVPQPGNLKP